MATKNPAHVNARAPASSPACRALATGITLACTLAIAPVRAEGLLTSRTGSIEFDIGLKTASVSFLKPQTIMRGTSSDGTERFELKVIGNDLVVIRDARPCLRLSARVQNAIAPGSLQRVGLRWNGASASVTVGGRGEAALEPSGVDELPRFGSMALSLGSADVTAGSAIFNRLPPLVESAVDRRFAEQNKCFNPAALASAPVEDAHRGIGLRGVADGAQRQQLARWIDAMTPEMLATVKSISVTNDGAQTWRGLSIPGSLRAMLLRSASVVDPSVFFHEGAHLLDGSRGWRDSQDWASRFMGLSPGSGSFSPGAVGHLDASAPGEQLANFVGRAREESLGLSKAWMCASDSSCRAKLAFLAERGYVTKADAQALSGMTTTLVPPGGIPPGSTPSRGATNAGAAAAMAATNLASPARASHAPPTPNPTYRTETIVPPPGAANIDIVLSARHFRPIDIYYNGGTTVNPTWRGCKAEDVMNRLTKQRPPEVVSEPPLKGVSRSYGYFDFGTKKNKRHYLALDEMADGSIEMLLDMKGNGRLDQAPARRSMGHFKAGEKGFATSIEFPWAEVMDAPPFEGVVKLWFMSNPFEWSIAGFSKSSRTQLLGAVQLAGRQYDLIVADGAESDNDGDLTNDGVCLRRPGQKATCYKDAEARKGVLVDGKRYAFTVRNP